MMTSGIRVLAVALAVAGAGLSTTEAQATKVDFETQSAFRCDLSGVETDNGLKFTYGFSACFYSPSKPEDFPTVLHSTVMAIGYSDTTITTVSDNPFDLKSVDLALGPSDHLGLQADDTVVAGFVHGGGVYVVDLPVYYSFVTYKLNWTNLDYVEFGELRNSSQYLAFDNLVYNSGNTAPSVPEPATMVLFGAGLAGVGARRLRRKKQ